MRARCLVTGDLVGGLDLLVGLLGLLGLVGPVAVGVSAIAIRRAGESAMLTE
jgi:hypothetical protein